MSPELTSTHWSVVRAAASGSPSGAAALEAICKKYWMPLYALARRMGADAHSAEDLVQGFLSELLAKNRLKFADPARGRFRTFLMHSLKNYIAGERDRTHAQKRGGGTVTLSLNAEQAEHFYEIECRANRPDSQLFDRAWAATLLKQVLAQLESEMVLQKKARLYHALRPCLTAGEESMNYEQLAAELGMSQSAVKVAVYRLRRAYRDHLRRQIAQTVEDPTEIDDELRYLFQVLSGPENNL